MKTITLTDYECEVIKDYLFGTNICECYCYCDYKTDMCYKYKPDGTPRCKLKQAENSILEKLGDKKNG